MTRAAPDPVDLEGRARDIVTAPDGTALVPGEAWMSATIELVARVVRHAEVTPPVDGLSHLWGAPAMSGLHAMSDKAAPELRATRDLRYTLLDDVPVATLISGHALSAPSVLGEYTRSGCLPVADQCAGFATGGLLMNSFEAGDPAVVTGPEAPDLDHDADGWPWHPMAPLPSHGMRRRRRIESPRENAINAGPAVTRLGASGRTPGHRDRAHRCSASMDRNTAAMNTG